MPAKYFCIFYFFLHSKPIGYFFFNPSQVAPGDFFRPFEAQVMRRISIDIDSVYMNCR